MKTLLLMRHGKSSWKHPELADRDRPLAKRGVKASQHMGEFLAHKELAPQHIFASSAVRALETARLIGSECQCGDNITAVDEFYLAEPDIYINYLKTLPDDLERVMVVGHNPGMESLLQILGGEIRTLPTAVIAYLSLPLISWKDLNSETEGQLVEIWRPKEIPEELPEKEVAKKKKTRKVKEAKPAGTGKVEKARKKRTKK
jgi:phosphohistidine phosphatase